MTAITLKDLADRLASLVLDDIEKSQTISKERLSEVMLKELEVTWGRFQDHVRSVIMGGTEKALKEREDGILRWIERTRREGAEFKANQPPAEDKAPHMPELRVGDAVIVRGIDQKPLRTVVRKIHASKPAIVECEWPFARKSS